MADLFNTYFSTVCASSETDNSNMPTHSVYLSNPPNTTFQFEEIDNRTVLQYINNMKPSYCCGHDSISSNTLKLIACEVSLSLTLIITQSLSTGIFSDSLKTAKVIPFHKKNEKNNNIKLSPYFYITCVVQNNRECYALATNALF